MDRGLTLNGDVTNIGKAEVELEDESVVMSFLGHLNLSANPETERLEGLDFSVPSFYLFVSSLPFAQL